jgi:hypothetical protein
VRRTRSRRPSLRYTLLFGLFLVHDAGVRTTCLSLDAKIEGRIPASRRIAELGSRRGDLDRGAIR